MRLWSQREHESEELRKKDEEAARERQRIEEDAARERELLRQRLEEQVGPDHNLACFVT